MILFTLIPASSKKGASARALGPFVVVRMTESRSVLTLRIASIPAIAPVGM